MLQFIGLDDFLFLFYFFYKYIYIYKPAWLNVLIQILNNTI